MQCCDRQLSIQAKLSAILEDLSPAQTSLQAARTNLYPNFLKTFLTTLLIQYGIMTMELFKGKHVFDLLHETGLKLSALVYGTQS